MRIAIDISPVSLREGRGFRRHVLGLLRSLAENSTPHQYLVLSSDRQPLEYPIPEGTRFRHEGPRKYLPMLHRRGTGLLGRLYLREVDLVHFPCGDIWYSPRGKALVTLHDLAPVRFPERFFKTRKEERGYQIHLEMIARHATLIIAVSHHTRKDILKYLQVPPERVRTIHNAIDPIFIEETKPLSEKELERIGIKMPYFLFVGALDFRKNIPLLLEAFSLYRQRGGGANLVLVGKQAADQPNYYPPLQPLLDKAREKDHIFWLSNITDGVLPRIYARARGFVFPSQFEGFGYPLIEAMACGTPVIATRLTSVPEIAGDAALLIEPIAEEIAQAMTRLDQDDSLRAQLTARGRERMGYFLPRRLAEEMAKVYDTLGQ